jgi:hypothetical protein
MHPIRHAIALALLLLTSVPLCLGNRAAAGVMDGFMDPTDGQFDASNWLLTKRGFLLNPMIITEPALGYGAGATALFFHKSKTDRERDKNADEHEALGLPPSISFAVGAGTETKSWFTGGGHFGSFLEDRVRYLGGAGYMALNIDFYFEDKALPYSLDGVFVLQDLQVRILRSNFFLGVRYTYAHFESVFDFPSGVPGFIPTDITTDMSGLGPVFRYDSRDNIFNSNNGIELGIIPLIFAEALGSDEDYQILSTEARIYRTLFEKIVLAVRADSGLSFGDTPFYALPAISTRGVSRTRYQNEFAVSSEIQGRWEVWKRWSLLGFVGLGWSGGDIKTLPSSEFVPSGGGGFRYQMARLIDLQLGMDFAGSPEQFAFYFAIGTGW